MANLTATLKQLVKETMDTFDLSDVISGTVTKINPLEVKIDPKLTLEEDFLILTNNVKDYTVDITVEDWQTEFYGSSEYRHNHAVKGKKKITVHNALKVGDEVIMLQQKGGQMYVILDKIKGGS